MIFLQHINRGSERKSKGQTNGEVERHINLENTDKTEHDIYTYKTENTKL